MIERLVQYGVVRASADADTPAIKAVIQWLEGVRGQFDESVMLATCERAELYGLLHDPAPELARPQAVRVRHGSAVVRHLHRVAAGLESRIVGEPHVLGQVARALAAAQERSAAGPTLESLFCSAVHTGRRVRRTTPLGRAAASCVTLAVDHLMGRVGRLRHVAILGTGAVAAEVGSLLAARGVERLTIVSRRVERAAQLAARLARAEPVTLASMASTLATADALVTATAAPRALVDRSSVPRRTTDLIVVDLGVPRNVDPSLGRRAEVKLTHLDALTPDRRSTVDAVRAAERVVDSAVADWLAGPNLLRRRVAS